MVVRCCIGDQYADTMLNIDFSEFKDVSNAFIQLFSTCQNVVNLYDKQFKTIRNSCAILVKKPLKDLLKQATNVDQLFEILSENTKYCNWMNVRLLHAIAIACGNKQLQSLIKNYTEVIYSKTLSEVWDTIPHYIETKNKHYSELKTTFSDKNPESVTIKELLLSKPKLAKEIAMEIAVIEEHSLVVTWLIPTDEVYQAYLSFLTVPQQTRKDDLVQFGTWMAYLPQKMLQQYNEEINCG